MYTIGAWVEDFEAVYKLIWLFKDEREVVSTVRASA